MYDFYSHQLGSALERFYEQNDLSSNVIAYRKLKKANYHFAAEAWLFAQKNMPVCIQAFDISNFFDTLDHAILKEHIKDVLDSTSLSEDWYKVFRSLTNFHFVERNDLRTAFETAQHQRNYGEPIATIKQVRDAGITLHSNPRKNAGIPQGTSISAVLSNVYMTKFDLDVAKWVEQRHGFYRRYSDDILVITKQAYTHEAKQFIESRVKESNLALNVDKTERTMFEADQMNGQSTRNAQYLGFTLQPAGISIRASTMSRQWRRLRKGVRRIKEKGKREIDGGRTNRIHTQGLSRRFTANGTSNFSAYARRSANAVPDSRLIIRQLRRFERAAINEIRQLRSYPNDGRC